jgi:hypothetical protein
MAFFLKAGGMTPDPVLFLEASEVTHLIALRLLFGIAFAFEELHIW